MRLIALIYGVIHTLSGIAACITFMILRFYATAVLGLVTVTHLIILESNGDLQAWYGRRELKQLCVLGYGVFTAGCVSLIYFTIYLILENIFDVVSITAIVWSYITAFTGIWLMYYSHKFNQPVQQLLSAEAQE